MSALLPPPIPSPARELSRKEVPLHIPDQSGADRFVVISGCSSGGKSTLLAELGRRGYAVVEEPGRRIVREELKAKGSALPWVDATAFLRGAPSRWPWRIERQSPERGGWVFFDRGLIDATVALQHLTGAEALLPLHRSHRYHPIGSGGATSVRLSLSTSGCCGLTHRSDTKSSSCQKLGAGAR